MEVTILRVIPMPYNLKHLGGNEKYILFSKKYFPFLGDSYISEINRVLKVKVNKDIDMIVFNVKESSIGTIKLKLRVQKNESTKYKPDIRLVFTDKAYDWLTENGVCAGDELILERVQVDDQDTYYIEHKKSEITFVRSNGTLIGYNIPSSKEIDVGDPSGTIYTLKFHISTTTETHGVTTYTIKKIENIDKIFPEIKDNQIFRIEKSKVGSYYTIQKMEPRELTKLSFYMEDE